MLWTTALLKPLNLCHDIDQYKAFEDTKKPWEIHFRTGLMNLSTVLKIPGWRPVRICSNSSPRHVAPSLFQASVSKLWSVYFRQLCDFQIWLLPYSWMRCVFLGKPHLCFQLQNSQNTKRDSRDLGCATVSSNSCSSVSWRLPADSTKPVPRKTIASLCEDHIKWTLSYPKSD